jgi:ABC-type sugar transport system permease subunit
VARLLAIAPFFVMPTVAALIWKNLMMHPIYGVFGAVARALGLPAVDWFAQYPLLSVIIIVSWEWLPFALLILLTAVQSLDRKQLEAARMDGAGFVSQFFFIVLPHLSRAISVVVVIETIFLLTICAEIFVTTAGGPGNATTNLAFLIYARALLHYDVGGASAGGVVAIVLANIVAFFLVRSIARRLGGVMPRPVSFPAGTARCRAGEGKGIQHGTRREATLCGFHKERLRRMFNRAGSPSPPRFAWSLPGLRSGAGDDTPRRSMIA